MVRATVVTLPRQHSGVEIEEALRAGRVISTAVSGYFVSVAYGESHLYES